jgi:hypothetical protein
LAPYVCCAAIGAIGGLVSLSDEGPAQFGGVGGTGGIPRETFTPVVS